MRLGATLLDGLFAGLAVFLSFLPTIITQSKDAAGWSIAIALVLFTALVLGNLLLLAANGQTLAKYLLKIRVTRRDGSLPSLSRFFFARYLPVTVLGGLPFIGIVVTLVDALMIFRDNRRCLHDEIADTIVVKA